MTVRWPESLRRRGDMAPSPLEAELMAEKAAALAQSGRRVESALAALAGSAKDSPGRPALLRAASDAVYYYFIQRELIGLRDHRPAIDHYAIPSEVLLRLGVS